MPPPWPSLLPSPSLTNIGLPSAIQLAYRPKRLFISHSLSGGLRICGCVPFLRLWLPYAHSSFQHPPFLAHTVLYTPSSPITSSPPPVFDYMESNGTQPFHTWPQNHCWTIVDPKPLLILCSTGPILPSAILQPHFPFDRDFTSLTVLCLLPPASLMSFHTLQTGGLFFLVIFLYSWAIMYSLISQSCIPS